MTVCIFPFAGINSPVDMMHILIIRHWRGMTGIALRKGSIQHHSIRDQYISFAKSNKSVRKMTGYSQENKECSFKASWIIFDPKLPINFKPESSNGKLSGCLGRHDWGPDLWRRYCRDNSSTLSSALWREGKAEPAAGRYIKGWPKAGLGSSCRAAAPPRAGSLHGWGGLGGSLLPSAAFGQV